MYTAMLIFSSQVKENWKLVLASFMLVLVGMGLIGAGICVSVIPVPNVEQIVFYVAGAICFIPGIVQAVCAQYVPGGYFAE